MAVARPPDPAALAEAAEALRAGRLVVFPTETVYGLGANALDARAVRGIFAAKGRPADNPLIVHVADTAGAQALTRGWPEEAAQLAAALWPGPLTLVLPRRADIPDVVTAGLDSVAVRVPRHPVASALLSAAGVPIAAPSANRSGRPSPTRVQDALGDLGEQVAIYLDGGATQVGLESTVVGLLEGEALLLRTGGVSREEIEQILGRQLTVRSPSSAPALSPGMKYRHYAPTAKVHLAAQGELAALLSRLRGEGLTLEVIASQESVAAGIAAHTPGARSDGAAWAHALFSLLRDLDRPGVDAIVVEEIPEAGLGAAVMNRLRKAAQGS